MLRWLLGSICLALWVCVPAAANVEMEGIAPEALFPWASFNPDIPTQKEIVGFNPGSGEQSPFVQRHRKLDVHRGLDPVPQRLAVAL